MEHRNTLLPAAPLERQQSEALPPGPEAAGGCGGGPARQDSVLPPPPALVRQVATEEPQAPQLTQAQTLRLQLAQAAQERRAQAHLRMVGPIRSFYNL